MDRYSAIWTNLRKDRSLVTETQVLKFVQNVLLTLLFIILSEMVEAGRGLFTDLSAYLLIKFLETEVGSLSNFLG